MLDAFFNKSLKTRSRGVMVFFGLSLLTVGILFGVGGGPDLSLSSEGWLQAKGETHLTYDLDPKPFLLGALPVGQSRASLQNTTFIQVAKMARPAVVNISTRIKPESPAPLRSPFFDDPFFRRFF